MKITLSILISLFSTIAFSQKTIEINNDKSSRFFYNNLKKTEKNYRIVSFKSVKEKTIRIWKGEECFVLSKNSYYIRRFSNIKTGKTSLFTRAISGNLDSFNIDKIKRFNTNYYYIDCFPIAMEVIDTNCYFEKVVGCNIEVDTLISKFHTNELILSIKDFIMKLPSGEYVYDLTTFIVNQPIKDSTKKSTFYKKIETELLANKIIIDNPTNEPLIYINNKEAYFEDINNLDETKIKSYKIISDNKKLVFGFRAMSGVILIETNK